MKISLITTVYNEGKTIDVFLKSIAQQTQLPDELVITDAGSIDNTVEKLKKYQTAAKFPVKIIIKRGNRSVGRNEAIKQARGEILACSDAGCILEKSWLKNITKPFNIRHPRGSGDLNLAPQKKHSIDVVSGFYLPKTTNIFEQCLATYTCTMYDKIDRDNFLPSSRSIAFTKSAWEKVEGYPSYLNTCEDLVFATRLKKAGCTFIFAEDTIVYWPQRKNLLQAFQQFFSYALGDGQARFIRPQVPLLFLRYGVVISLVIIGIFMYTKVIISALLTGFVFYIIWAINKNYHYINHSNALLYLPLLQFTADIAVLFGTSIGMLYYVLCKQPRLKK